MIFLFFYFITLQLFFIKKRSVAFFLNVILLLSSVGAFFLGREIKIQTNEDIGWLLLTMLLYGFIIIPWKSYKGIKTIDPVQPVKLKRLTRFLLIINAFVFLILLLTTVIVMVMVKDINEFKYSEGVSMQFYYTMLPFPVFFFNVSVLLYYFSYFLLPLHFYYLFKKRYLLSVVCLILSFNIVLYGLSFFSRAVVVQYLLLYSAILFMLGGSMSRKVKSTLRRLAIIVVSLSVFYFIIISQKRFQEDRDSAKIYANTIPHTAVTQDPVLYSYLDYASQGFFNGFEVLQLYKDQGFAGALTYGSVSSFFDSPTESYKKLKYRQKLWPYHYSYSFNGFVAYAVYDYGVMGSICFGLLYFMIVYRMRPRNGIIKLKSLFIIALMIQIPLMSIFYNQIGGIFIAFILWIPLNIYLKYNVKES